MENMQHETCMCAEQECQKLSLLLFGKGDLHGGGGRDLEALEGVPCRGGLQLVLELHEGDVVSPRHQTNLPEMVLLS
jgi:hypothetical protein